jgi:hypothetical protein
MEKNRIVWNPSRSFLGLILLCTIFLFPLNSKEIFNVSLKDRSYGFDFSNTQTVSFYVISNEEIDADRMIESISQGKADVIITGENGIEGRALTADIFVDVIVNKNIKEQAWLVIINAYVNGEAKESVDKNGKDFAGSISIANHVLTFTDATRSKEVENAISTHLQDLVDNITHSTKAKPKFFVVH